MTDKKAAWQNLTVDHAGYLGTTVDSVNAVVNELSILAGIEVGSENIFGEKETVESARADAAKIIRAQIQQLQKIATSLDADRIDQSLSDDIGWDAKQSI